MATSQEFFQAAAPFFQCYEAGDYPAALESAEKLADSYPEHAVHTILWRVCLTGRLGRADEALRLFEMGQKTGYWWSERELRQDPDLEALQGLPEFEKLLDANAALHKAAQTGSKPDLRVFEPDSSVPSPPPWLIALHGRGYTPDNDNAPDWKQACSLGWLVALPRSSQFCWSNAYGWDDRELAGQEIIATYAALRARYAIDPERLVIAGMSQGAALAIHMALGGKLPVPRIHGSGSREYGPGWAGCPGPICPGKRDERLPGCRGPGSAL